MDWQDVVAMALAEDIGPGDITTQATVPVGLMARGVILAKQAGVLAGLEVAAECFYQVDGDTDFQPRLAEGDEFAAGAQLAVVIGQAGSLLTAERTALNFLQRLCGTATLTRAFVDRVSGAKARIVDTRKTAPGLRQVQRAAVRAGGGGNHRFALYDGVLLKDNHIAVAGGIGPAVAAAKAGAPHTLKIEVEVTDLEQLQEAIAAGADVALLDNMSSAAMRQAVALAAGRLLLEASGGVTLANVAEVAATGVDLISVGALTHSAPAIDLSLEIVPI